MPKCGWYWTHKANVTSALTLPSKKELFISRPANRLELLKIILPAVCATILFTLVLFGVIIPYYRASLMHGKKEMIRELIYSSWKIIESMQHMEASGVLSRDEAQRRAMEQVRALRYGDGGKDYFWINDMQSVMLMHPYRAETLLRKGIFALGLDH